MVFLLSVVSYISAKLNSTDCKSALSGFKCGEAEGASGFIF